MALKLFGIRNKRLPYPFLYLWYIVLYHRLTMQRLAEHDEQGRKTAMRVARTGHINMTLDDLALS